MTNNSQKTVQVANTSATTKSNADSRRKKRIYGTKTEEMIHTMLVNVGADVCDSVKVDDFRTIDSVRYSRDDYVTKHAFHILADVLYYERDMDIKFQKFANNYVHDESNDGVIEGFCKKFEGEIIGSEDTYCDEYALCDRILQCDIIDVDNTKYVILSIHAGGDARTGYGRPHVFSMADEYSFENATRCASLRCDCGEVSTLNGEDWEACNGDIPDCSWDDGLCEDWYWKDDKLHCKKCGEEVTASS